ncbi:hypothetical protein UFOVP636_12 [uncultured Caudovirales phage]|jgi:hypothetical protein|uniref:Uncharacterized protein n=1 Tax=uncultured Caudovirales phage TaxID=2100421 RepID=A0A6J5NDP9_9CAUD|nr:hypothetical protein UFOVP636_12 [uncultured Caudovirales phage]
MKDENKRIERKKYEEKLRVYLEKRKQEIKNNANTKRS